VTSDIDHADLALRGLRVVRDAALEEGKPITAKAFDDLIIALGTGGDHPLLRRWLDLRAGNAGNAGEGEV
jgi:hypothetical protein